MIEATARPLTANLWTRAFGESLQGFLQTLKARWLSLLVLQIMAGMAGEFFNQAQGVVMQKSEDMLMIFALVGAQFLFLLFWSAAWIALVTTTLPLKQDSIGVLSKNLNQLMIESFRSFSRVILWLPALFIPAIIQYVRLSLVPYVVLFDEEYQAGQVDALTRSWELSRRHFWVLVLALLIGAALPEILAAVIFGSDPSLMEAPVRTVISWLVTLILNLWGTLFLFSIYRTLHARREKSC